VSNLIKTATEVRYGIEADNVKDEVIEMTEQWANELSEMAFTSRQRGRMSHLLKKKSKVVKKQKPRAYNAPFVFMKRFQGPGGKA